MAKLATTQPIPIGTATGGSDHRTNTGQLQQTSTLRICRADPDPPRADGLLCRTVGPAFRPRTTHRHRIGNEDSKQHPVTSGRKADTVPHPRWVASNQSNSRLFRLLNVSALLRFGLSSEASVSAPLPRPATITITASTKNKRLTKRGTNKRSKSANALTSVHTAAAIHRCTDPWFHRCPGASSSPQLPGWSRFTRLTTARSSMLGTGFICRKSVIHHV